MKVTKWIAALVLVDFALLTAYAVAKGDLGATFSAIAGDIWLTQLGIDLVVGLSVALGFMIADARRLGVRWVPFVVLTFLTGSIGPLAYLVYRGFFATRRAEQGRNADHGSASVAAQPVVA